MPYGLLTAFIDAKLSDDDPPEKWAQVYAERWSQLNTEKLEAELVPLFRKLRAVGIELKRTGRFGILGEPK